MLLVQSLKVPKRLFVHLKNFPINKNKYSKADHGGRTIFARSNAGIVGSYPTRSIDVCVRLFCV
jgi:hypothetical protein